MGHAGAHAARRDDEIALAQFEQPGAHHARKDGPGEQRDDHDGGGDAGAGDRGEDQKEDDRRQGHGQIDKPHGGAIDEPPAEGGQCTDQKADDGRDDDRDESDGQRGAATLQ